MSLLAKIGSATSLIHVGILQQQEHVNEAINLCLSIPNGTKEILKDQNMLNSQKLFEEKQFSLGFEMFRLSNMHPRHIVSRFSTLIPTKIGNEVSIESWLDKNPLPLEAQESKEELGQLMIFIEESMKSYALTGSEIMIMNTVLFQCIFVLKPEKIQFYISQNLPLWFDTVAKFLLKNNAFSAFLVLCRNSCKHTIALSYLKDSCPISDLVNYIQ